MIEYHQYMDIFALEIERLHLAVHQARFAGQPEDYDSAVRLFIGAILRKAREIGRREIYEIDPDVYLPGGHS